MADQKKRISELPPSSDLEGLYTIGVNKDNESVKVPLGEIVGGATEAANAAERAASDANAAATRAEQKADSNAQTIGQHTSDISTLRSDINSKDAEMQVLQNLSLSAHEVAVTHGVARFDGFLHTPVTITQQGITNYYRIVFNPPSCQFLAVRGDKYYNAFPDSSEYNAGLMLIHTDKVYLCGTLLYVWDNEQNTLIVAGSDPQAVDEKISNAVSARQFFNASVLLGLTSATNLTAVTSLINALDNREEYTNVGTVLTFLGVDGWETWQWNGNGGFTQISTWKKFGGSAAVGNCYNVTVDAPITGYYSLVDAEDTSKSATHVAFSKGYAATGIQITFEIARGSWKTYQYVGSQKTLEAFTDADNWQDLAGMSAGSEPVININDLCQNRWSLNGNYTLSTAITAIKNYIQETQINYAKPGLVISYRVAENTYETKQFNGAASDFEEVDLWKDFGGGGSQVETSPTPVSGGEDAFSTGGAYEEMIADFVETVDVDEGVKSYQAVSASGKEIGNPIEVPLGGGGGGSSTSSFSITFQDNPLYAAYGGNIRTKAAIRSVNYEGTEETRNFIKRLSIVDAATGVTLFTEQVNKVSSASVNSFDFDLDFTPYFNSAASKDFTIVAVDDENNARRKNITVTAVDATVTVGGDNPVQTLHYTAITSLEVGGSAKQINLYKFAKNASKQGINAVVEIFYNNAWHTLGEAVIQDTYTHAVTINPCNLLGSGERLSHGAYLLRIQGTDVASQVTGNIVYTSIMCIDCNSNIPVLAIRYDDKNDGTAKLYETVKFEVAAYTPNKTSTEVIFTANDEVVTSLTALTSTTHPVEKQIQGYVEGDTIDFKLKSAVGATTYQTPALRLLVQGSAISAALKDGAAFVYDFASRTNQENDHTISNNGVTMSVVGSNWSSNGFVKYLGSNCLRIAENVTAEIPYSPFTASAETNGCAVQFMFATNNIKDADAMLMECYDKATGAGFYVKGNKAAIYCATGDTNKVEERSFRCGEIITMAVVVEPSSIYHTNNGSNYSNIKMFLNGEEVACLGYHPNTNAITNSRTINFRGVDGDFYLYYFLPYPSYYEWAQAFTNYLVKLRSSAEMVEEFNNEQVLNLNNEPSLESLKNKGIPYYVVVADNVTFTTFDGDTDTSAKFECTLFYFNPQYPCLNFKCTHVQWRRQGTTSAQRPVKNDRFYLKKPVNKADVPVMTLLNPDPTTELGQKAIALAALNYTMVTPNGIPVQVITVKVDYSDSSNANDCGVCDQMNATFRALGGQYLTPAQRAYDGSFTKGDLVLHGFQLDHSTKNHPIAAFRATSEGLSDAYFHAKGNWKEDKSEQVALGFKDTPGYNKGCLNYGDFVEFFGNEGETLAQIETRFKATADLDTSKIYLLSLYCGRNYRFMEYKNGSWQSCTGSMTQNAQGKWVITGKVLNPVIGFELLNYQGMDWFKGVSCVADMMQMKPDMSSWVQKLKKSGLSATTFPAWTYYFECMIDDDQLAIDFALGKKVPYELYRFLKFCNDCDMMEEIPNSDGKVQYVANSAKETKWRNEFYLYASPHSSFAYNAFTDYDAAGDQRAKNMQPMWYLEPGHSVVNGVYDAEEAVRMYLNKIYDCDTCNGKDNDGGCTFDPEADPNKPSSIDGSYTNPYAGWGSVFFNNMAHVPEVKIDAAGTLLSLNSVVFAMRSATINIDGVNRQPFSPEGANYFFVQKRLKFWPKLVSSYDGERKYIRFTNTANKIYFYALQGLGLTSLPRFIEQRWRIRDGYYQVGDFYAQDGIITGRINGGGENSTAKIRIKAAKTGYFGVGNDSAGSLSESVFLEAGQTHEFTNFSKTEGALLYIYQADRMSEIDLSDLTLDNGFNFSVMKLAEKIILGSPTKRNLSLQSYTPLQGVALGELPFLEVLDITKTSATMVDASGCPRLKTLLADNSQITRCIFAETSPVETATLPATVSTLQLKNLPKLAYPMVGEKGLSIASGALINSFMVSGCEKIDVVQLLTDITTPTCNLTSIGLRGLDFEAPLTLLQKLMDKHTVGLDQNGIAFDETNRCSGLQGKWIATTYQDPDYVAQIDAYFPDLQVYNTQFTTIVFDDVVEDAQNITNCENNTTGDNYEASGHLLNIRRQLIPVKGKLNVVSGKWVGERISEVNYRKLYDGTDFDYADNLSAGFDVMMRCPHLWYKGINDFKNQKKYICWSSVANEPISTAKTTRRYNLSDILFRANAVLYSERASVGDNILTSENIIAGQAQYNVYRVSVKGMKQVRFPGVNSAQIGGAFIDADGNIVRVFNMAITHTQFDFVNGSDYIFTDVPANADSFMFSTLSNATETAVIVTDSTNVEAIEPDWVENKPWLGGVYQASIDGLTQMRSISGANTRTGTGTQTTSAEWTYDANGRPTNTPVNDLNYTYKDLQNLAARRGTGYQCFDYEMSKLMANLWYSLNGTRDAQITCGYGRSAGGATGTQDAVGNADTVRTSASNGNKCLGFENFFGCTWEIMDNIAVNIPDYVTFLRDSSVATGNYPIDGIWHIFDPITRTERTVQGYKSGLSGKCIARVKHGRFCDMVPATCATDTSRYALNYTDGFWYTHDRGRLVGRSGSSAFAVGGLAYASASNASSRSNSYDGSRLAFRGEIEITNE